ncbi:sigma-54-dependent Fis family transcriptional regulator [Vibrio parahaemolyticus]|uniref:sigma-54-dependent transcriptional regulator n=1 Tax=Vibrio parahaemolyticus TaxID=670 RepID=UPI00073F8FD2|nr:sigma-54 dependent transcriptional regulator [Vibrio parahaemolyticus]EME0093958.1 sigma-54-dependent Fis family transcriptional regulator [Vibrio parahaemolyticus]KUH61513.1 two-component system response regulator [Vibrio parahaemolyticus]
MSKNTHTILVADDDTNILSTLKLMLKVHQFDVVTAQTPDQALDCVKQHNFDLAIVDLNYQLDTTSGQEGLTLIDAIRALDSELPVIVMTGWGSIDIAVQAMQKGGADFIEKPWDNERLLHMVSTQIKLRDSQRKQRYLEQENQFLKAQVQHKQPTDLVAESPLMRNLLDTLKVVAQSDANILLTGDNGTGKSLLAQFIHQHSVRHQASFVAVDMSCIPETLFESEMFGHVKGAFTDAKQTRLGRFELADRGTLFLDEIGNTPLPQQAKLLRALESNQFEKVGGTKTQHVDVRVIAATNADLPNMVQSRTFRQDVFYRLNTFEFRVPALKERVEDIIPLTEQFIERYSGKYRKPIGVLSDSAQQVLQAYDWPGNVRELSHVVERMVLLGNGEYDRALTVRVLPEQANLTLEGDAIGSTLPEVSELLSGDMSQTLDRLEHTILQQRLAHWDGNANLAAESLGLSRSAFYRRLNKSKP